MLYNLTLKLNFEKLGKYLMHKDPKHIHLQSCESTQDHLIELIEDNSIQEDILISTAKQTKGRGRQGNTWDSTKNAIAMSFTITPNEVLTLSSLEMGALICRYFDKYNVSLKWPNDLISKSGLKCGGILCQNKDGQIIVGVGLNLGNSEEITPNEDLKFGRGCMFKGDFSDQEIENESLEIYKYILANRLDPQQVREYWNEYNTHLNKEVVIKDESREFRGKFSGIGENGEALIESPSGIQRAYSGSLFID
jgi:BirA family biotin operon repressor/biotin-[acetyl-CoA-carboxylase] ligase